ncbi:ATP-dependent DNA ligase [Streptomyces diacarni]|uniref:ATP-dependent DNA ligase n=1 Tax=Streptomyces diacarni TaxID=2800381 RepID=UPI0033E1C5B4
MLLADIARTSARITEASGRNEKVSLLAELFGRTGPDEVPVVVTYLAGRLPQRRTGVGWSTLREMPPPAARPTLTIAETDAAFAALAGVSGKGAQAARKQRLDALLARATADEQHFLVRLIGGELRQGALDAFAVEGLAAAIGAEPGEVRRAVMLGGSLGTVAQALLAEGPGALSRFGIEVGRPVLPMLAHTARSVDEALDKVGPCAVEEKLDGIRVQVHKDGDRVRVYTRTLEEITDRLPEAAEVARQAGASQAVLDGEVIALAENGWPRPFQEVSGRVASRLDVAGASSELPLHPVFFDVLFLDGEDLLERPSVQRHAALARVLPEERRVRRVPVPDPQDEQARAGVRAFAEEVLARGHEGVVVKALDAGYSAGRRGASWRKVKPVHTLDLVVLGAEWGHGRRAGKLSNLHLGARREDGTFAMLGKTFKGLTDALLAWQTERLGELSSEETAWGVRVRPEQVVEIAFDGVQRSTRYPEGVTLRFARVVRYREDKRPEDADTVETVTAMLR